MHSASKSVTPITPITSIIPNMIFGLVLIIGWLPVIIMTERNNKGNIEELKILEDEIKNNLILTNVKVLDATEIKEAIIDGYGITDEDMKYKNVYIISNKNTKTKDSVKIELSSKIIAPPFIDGVEMDHTNYIYLATQNKLSSHTINNPNNDNITYTIDIYAIPTDKKIMKVEGLDPEKIDMEVFTYEFGPEDDIKKILLNRKDKSNKLQMWLGRIGTFLMLLIGLSLLVSPLTALVQLGDALPGPLQLLAIPGHIILGLYESLSFFGSLLLTLLMTFFVWSLINMPHLALVIGGLLVGLLLYFHKK